MRSPALPGPASTQVAGRGQTGQPGPERLVDVFVTDAEPWATVDTGFGQAHRVSVPTATGRAAGTAWRLPLTPEIPGHVGRLLREHPATPRAIAFGRIVAMAAELVRAGDVAPVPGAGAGHWEWVPAPDSATAGRLRDALAVAAAEGLTYVGPHQTVQSYGLLSQLVTALAGAPPIAMRGSRRAWADWADVVTARREAGVRLAFQLVPPGDDTAAGEPVPADPEHWILRPGAVALGPTAGPGGDTAAHDPAPAPAESLDDMDFDHDDVLAAWLAAEQRALRKAWPDGPGVSTCAVPPEGVLDIVDRVVPRLLSAGIDVLAPQGVLRAARPRRTVSGEGGTGLLGRDGLQLTVAVEIDDRTLSPDELRAVVAAPTDLVSVGDRWVRVGQGERDRLARLLDLTGRPVSAAQIMAEPAFDGCDWAPSVFGRLERARRVLPPPEVRAELRHYQRDGLDWLTWIEETGSGGILADDMGLGKTLQVLCRVAADHPGPTLVVCPVTLVDTWLRQAAQFTPSLRVRAHHGTERATADIAAGVDIVVTTYGLLARDSAVAQVAWHRVVLDEAQAVKNPDTRAARAARGLTAEHRIAVTGTPVENHVGDLWSLLAFSSPGLLPRRSVFRRRFAGKDTGEAELSLLRAVTSPLILRRVKTDPTVAPDLPDRVVVRDDCRLTREQVTAYEAAVAHLMAAVASDDPGIARRATVLAAITRLKQICVHPALPGHQTGGVLGDRSGKIERLVELCAEIVAEGQAVVVFTQFASIVPALAAHLAYLLGVGVLTLTGSDSRSRRAATVDGFGRPDAPPLLVASIKAGGTGLTLVRANHVVHLDRWWNPAVEDQASDRVWRIGQGQKVVVHTLVCPGTLEERIDAVLQHKRTVANSVIAVTEKAVTELSPAELEQLVTLSGEAMR